MARMRQGTKGQELLSTKVDIVWHMKPTAEDVTALLSSNKLGDPNELTRFAKTRGLLFGDGHAEKFLAGIATNEAMLLELARHKFPELHARLRVPITGHDQSGATVTALPPESKTAPLADMSAPMSVTGHGTTMARSSPVPSVVAAAAVHVRGTGGGGGGIVVEEVGRGVHRAKRAPNGHTVVHVWRWILQRERKPTNTTPLKGR